jgi:tRNA A37 threonylcarbamoyladenosine synthetase subunit TsaC/SUA5/YrdC
MVWAFFRIHQLVGAPPDYKWSLSSSKSLKVRFMSNPRSLRMLRMPRSALAQRLFAAPATFLIGPH